MIIDLFKLKRSGKDQEQIVFEYQTENELSTLPGVEIVYPIKVDVLVSLTGNHSALVECDVSFTLKGDCTRCLSQTEKTYSFSISESCDGESVYPVVNDKITLDKMVEDAVLFNMPITFICKEDCKGLCFNCGANLNTQNCKCKK